MYRSAFFSIALFLVVALVPAARSVAQRADSSLNGSESQILSLINNERDRRRLPSLMWNDELANLARNYSRTMAREHFFDHIDNDGNSVVERATHSRIRGWSKIGENLFYCSPDDQFTYLAVRGWMRSPTHRENILDPEWRETGIGIAYARDGKIYVTEIFAAD